MKRSRRATKVQRRRFAASLRTSRLQVSVLACSQANQCTACLVMMHPAAASRCMTTVHVQKACSNQAMCARLTCHQKGHHALPAKTLAHLKLGRWHASVGHPLSDMGWYMPEVRRGLLRRSLCGQQQAVLTGWQMHVSLTHAGNLTSSLHALQRAEADAKSVRALLERERRDKREMQQGLLMATAALAGQTCQVRLSSVHVSSVSPMPWLGQNIAAMLSRHSSPGSLCCRSIQSSNASSRCDGFAQHHMLGRQCDQQLHRA